MISVSIAVVPSGFSTALSKSNSALVASVIFCTPGAIGGGGGGGGGGAGGGGAGGAAFGTRSGSHSTIAIAGVQ